MSCAFVFRSDISLADAKVGVNGEWSMVNGEGGRLGWKMVLGELGIGN